MAIKLLHFIHVTGRGHSIHVHRGRRVCPVDVTLRLAVVCVRLVLQLTVPHLGSRANGTALERVFVAHGLGANGRHHGSRVFSSAIAKRHGIYWQEALKGGGWGDRLGGVSRDSRAVCPWVK